MDARPPATQYELQSVRVSHGVLLLLFTSMLLMSGCKIPACCCNRVKISGEVESRTSHSIAAADSCPGEVFFPPVVNLEDGLTEDEAVAIALWNNRSYLAALSNLGIAQGDLIQASLLSNPQFNLLFPPIGSKQLEWTLFVPIEALILRSNRIEVAERDLQQICNDLVQNGLNVARDARLAFADYQFAVDRLALAKEAEGVRAEIADLAEKRFQAGDIGELEVISARVDANRSIAEAAGLEWAVMSAEVRLKNVLGIASTETVLYPVNDLVASSPDINREILIAEALSIRPDIKAACLALEAAKYREALARKSFLRIDAVADGNSGGAGPTNSGPGLRFEIPIFNRNEGLILRSQWSVSQASHNYHLIRDQVITDVDSAIAQLQQADANLAIIQADVLPDLEQAVELSRRSYRDGGTGYFLVLQSTGQYIDTRVRELELEAGLRRAIAELDRSVGRKLESDASYQTNSFEPIASAHDPNSQFEFKLDVESFHDQLLATSQKQSLPGEFLKTRKTLDSSALAGKHTNPNTESGRLHDHRNVQSELRHDASVLPSSYETDKTVPMSSKEN